MLTYITPIIVSFIIVQIFFFISILWIANRQVKAFDELDDLQDQINFLHEKQKLFEQRYHQGDTPF